MTQLLLRRFSGWEFSQPRDSELQLADPPSDAFPFDFDKKVGEFADFLDCGFDDTLVQRFEGRIIIKCYSHQLFECVDRDERRFALIASGIEIVETDFPEN